MAERDYVAERPTRPPRPPAGRDRGSRPPDDRWERRPPPPPGGRPPRAPEPAIDSQAAMKGVLIVIVTIVVGAFVFWQGLHRPSEHLAPSNLPTGDPDRTPTTVASVATPTTAAEAVAAPPATRVPPAQLPIVVGNAVDPDKPVAGTVAAKLSAAGYTGTIRRLNATRTADQSKVHFIAPEWRDDAVAVAKALGIAEIEVTPLPNPPPVNAPEQKVFVIVGREPSGLSER